MLYYMCTYAIDVPENKIMKLNLKGCNNYSGLLTYHQSLLTVSHCLKVSG